MVRTLLAMTALVAGIGAARASVDGEALGKFGLLGHWAVDCSQPPSRTNPHTTFAPSQAGQPVYQMTMGDPAMS